MSNKILIVGAFACLSAMAMAQSGASTGNAAGQGQNANTQDAAAGLPAGKRMHKPVAVEQVSSKGTQSGGSADRESSQPSVSEVVVTKPAAAAQDSSKGTPSGGSADRESSQPSVSEAGVTKSNTGSKAATNGDLNNDGRPDLAAASGSTKGTGQNPVTGGNANGARDAASGQATGKRQHEPMTVSTKSEQKPKK